VILQITAGDIELIPINTVCGSDIAHYGLASKTYSIQHFLWCWYYTLNFGIYNLFPSTLSVVMILHIKVEDVQLIPFNTVCDVDTEHYRWRYTTYSIQHSLWNWYCPLEIWIYNLFPSTLSVVVLLPITAWDLKLIPFYTVCGFDAAHNRWGSTTHSLQYCLWLW
jgi:hypothetical protein